MVQLQSLPDWVRPSRIQHPPYSVRIRRNVSCKGSASATALDWVASLGIRHVAGRRQAYTSTARATGARNVGYVVHLRTRACVP